LVASERTFASTRQRTSRGPQRVSVDSDCTGVNQSVDGHERNQSTTPRFGGGATRVSRYSPTPTRSTSNCSPGTMPSASRSSAGRTIWPFVEIVVFTARKIATYATAPKLVSVWTRRSSPTSAFLFPARGTGTPMIEATSERAINRPCRPVRCHDPARSARVAGRSRMRSRLELDRSRRAGVTLKPARNGRRRPPAGGFLWMLATEPDVDAPRVPEATGAPIRRHRGRDRN
jgi:hypothetical protein